MSALSEGAASLESGGGTSGPDGLTGANRSAKANGSSLLQWQLCVNRPLIQRALHRLKVGEGTNDHLC